MPRFVLPEFRCENCFFWQQGRRGRYGECERKKLKIRVRGVELEQPFLTRSRDTCVYHARKKVTWLQPKITFVQMDAKR